MSWIAQQKRIYFGNANSVKEYRIQLRSVRTVWYWSLYLGVLVLVALSNYASIAHTNSSGSPAAVQAALTGYYQMVTSFVQGGILLIAPMVAASAIVNEYALRSIELVQCAPTSSKYFFVGKFIACMRQILMLLFLALPIAAVGVTLGGATWGQILEQFGYIAMQGCLTAALAMPIAVATKSILRTVGGVIGSTVLFSAVMGAIGSAMMVTASGVKVPPVVGLIPFASSFAVGQAFPIFGVEVPNWAICLVLTLLLVKVLLLGAGSALTRVGSKETVNIRLHGLGLLAIYSVLIGISIYSTSAYVPTGPDAVRAVFLAAGTPMIVPIFVILSVAGHGRMEERKFFADRFFEVKDTWLGRPSGGLGYSFLAVTITSLGVAVPLMLNLSFPSDAVVCSLLWNYSLGLFIFGVVWWMSTFFDLAPAGKRLAVGSVIGLGALLHFTGLTLDAAAQTYSFEFTGQINIFLPYATSVAVILAKAAVLAVFGGALIVSGERRRKNNLEILRRTGYLVDRDELTASRT